MPSADGGRLAAVRDALQTQLWPLPLTAVTLALALGVVLPRLEENSGQRGAGSTFYLFGGGAGAARTVLDAVASSLITVTSLTFSLTVVTLQLASSQFSPRLLRTFTRDRVVHLTLALFLATFTFALTVLRTVRTETARRPEFVPQASVTLAFVLALASVLALVLFLAHLARAIRVETMLKNVHRDASTTIRRVLPKRDRDGTAISPEPPAHAVALPAGSSGFLVFVDEDALVAAAIEVDAVVLVDRHPGASVIAGTPAAFAWPRGGLSFDRQASEQLRARAAKAIVTGAERTAAQDVGFGLRQLTDVAVKALSPGINDPTTAVHALSHIAALLCELAGRDLGPRLRADGDGEIRVVLRRPSLDLLLDLAISAPRQYGAGDPDVAKRLFGLLRELGWCADRTTDRLAIAEQLHRLRAAVAGRDFDAEHRAGLARSAEAVEEALAGRWPPSAAGNVSAAG